MNDYSSTPACHIWCTATAVHDTTTACWIVRHNCSHKVHLEASQIVFQTLNLVLGVRLKKRR